MQNIKLTIEYDGTRFSGWQSQNRGQRTVQETIENALKKICKEKIRINGSGRTDSGVHARAQVANFKTKSKRPAEDYINALNGNLPKDISILKVSDSLKATRMEIADYEEDGVGVEEERIMLNSAENAFYSDRSRNARPRRWNNPSRLSAGA